MFRTTLASLLVASSLVTAAAAEGAPTVKEIDVTVDLAAVQNAQAAAYWANLETDLENAIASRIADRVAEDGVKVGVDVSEVELSNGFTDRLNLADTRILAKVTMTHDSDNTRFGAYDLSVDVERIRPLLPAGMDVTVITPDTRAFYDALIGAVADEVVARLV